MQGRVEGKSNVKVLLQDGKLVFEDIVEDPEPVLVNAENGI